MCLIELNKHTTGDYLMIIHSSLKFNLDNLIANDYNFSTNTFEPLNITKLNNDEYRVDVRYTNKHVITTHEELRIARIAVLPLSKIIVFNLSHLDYLIKEIEE